MSYVSKLPAPPVASSLVDTGRIGKVAPAKLQCALASWPVKLRLSGAPAGEDLLVASADKPFRFPATFTFVVRSFTVLDGIGKSLDPRFDISEIAAPYARDLILEAQPQFAKLQQEFNKRLDKQVSACSCHCPHHHCGLRLLAPHENVAALWHMQEAVGAGPPPQG